MNLDTSIGRVKYQYLINESNIFSVDRGINQIGRKTASIRLAHCCKSFLFFLRLINRSTVKD